MFNSVWPWHSRMLFLCQVGGGVFETYLELAGLHVQRLFLAILQVAAGCWLLAASYYLLPANYDMLPFRGFQELQKFYGTGNLRFRSFRFHHISSSVAWHSTTFLHYGHESLISIQGRATGVRPILFGEGRGR